MSVSNQTNKTYGSGNGVTTTFSFSFKIFDVAELYAYKIAANGTVTGPLTYTTDFTATINPTTEGGTIIFVVAPASGTTWFLKRIVPNTQSAVIPSEGTLPGKQIENQLDLMTMMVIQAQEAINRAIQMPLTFVGTTPVLPTPVDGYALSWLGTDGTLQNLPIGSAAINTAVAACAASATAAAASATTASTGATTATTQATAAAASATAAAASAAAAAASANPSYIQCSNQQTSGTGGGTATSGAWRTCTLNTKDADTGSIATLTTNEITIPAGTYVFRAIVPFYITNYSQARLYNKTDSVVIRPGNGVFSDSSGNNNFPASHVSGRFTIAASKTIRLEYQVSTTGTTTGQGAPTSFGTEVYAQIELTKVA